MLPGIYNSAVQVEIGYHEPIPANSEEYGERYGHTVSILSLRDRLTLQAGQMLITIGQKLTETSLKRMHLSKDIA